jgi:hypothetical protein
MEKGCSTRTIDRYIRDGLVETRKHGLKKVEVNLDDVMAVGHAEALDPVAREHVRALVAAWPKLSPAQVDCIATLLRGEAA